MRISQYVYFAISSKSLPAADVTALLDVEPNRVLVRGSRDAERDVPRLHSWAVECTTAGLSVSEQIGRVITRVTPAAEKIIDLGKQYPEAKIVLQVVRNFNDEDGEEEEFSPPEATLQKLSGQHQLLGWHVDRSVIEFLHATGAELDVDEYG